MREVIQVYSLIVAVVCMYRLWYLPQKARRSADKDCNRLQ